MEQIDADLAILAQEANNFERISRELKVAIARIDATTGSVARERRLQRDAAARSALDRFRTAADRQVDELNEILGNIHTSGVQYPPTIAD